MPMGHIARNIQFKPFDVANDIAATNGTFDSPKDVGIVIVKYGEVRLVVHAESSHRFSADELWLLTVQAVNTTKVALSVLMDFRTIQLEQSWLCRPRLV